MNETIMNETIMNETVMNETVMNDDYFDLKETIDLLVNDYISSNIIHYIQPNFNKDVMEGVLSILLTTLNDIFGVYDIDNDYLKEMIKDSISTYYKYISPIRSYSNTFIRFKQTDKYKKKMKEKIEYLKNVPQPEQRTPEWYEFRYNHLTASNIWKTFLTESTRNQLIYEKCQPLNIDKYTNPSLVSIESPLHWGQKYEPLSLMLYEKLYFTKVSDFGCLPHPTLSCVAASPDGINTLETSNRYGRMLEIKNIYNREITGIPKLEYWVQMQVQMEVCNLNECDFLETRFKEYESQEEYEADTTSEYKGLIMLFVNERGNPIYEYAPIETTKTTNTPNINDEWQETIMNKNEHNTWIKNIYWRLDEMSCVLVLRNKLWFSTAKQQIENIWKVIEEEKETGNYIINRAPKKTNTTSNKAKKQNTSYNNNDISIKNSSTCFIDTTILDE
jgi:putative phage-type endonuclease